MIKVIIIEYIDPEPSIEFSEPYNNFIYFDDYILAEKF